MAAGWVLKSGSLFLNKILVNTLPIILVISLLFPLNVYAENNFTRINIGKGISMLSPKGWRLTSEMQRTQLNNSIEAQSGVSQNKNIILYAAACHTSKFMPSALLSVNYSTANYGYTQTEIANATSSQLHTILEIAKDGMSLYNKNPDRNLPDSFYDLDSIKVTKTKLGKYYAIETSSILHMKGMNMVNLYYAIPFKKFFLRIDCAYNVNEWSIFKPIIGKVVSSFIVDSQP